MINLQLIANLPTTTYKQCNYYGTMCISAVAAITLNICRYTQQYAE